MDNNQDLNRPLVINSENSENDLGAINIVDQPVNVDLLRDIENLDLYQVLHSVEDLSTVPEIKMEDEEIENDEVQELTQTLRKSRDKKIEKEIDLPSLYREILMNKVFEKTFVLDGQVDFVASRAIETEENDESVVYDKILVQNRAEKIFYLITNKLCKENSSDLKVIQSIPKLDFEYFEFSHDGNFIIFGNRGVIVLWDINNNSVTDVHKIEFKSTDDMNSILKVGEISNYKSLVMNDGNLDIYYSVGKFIFNVTINTVYEELLIEMNYSDVGEAPTYTYINIEESLIVVITTGKTSESQVKTYLKTIQVINPENMKIEGIQTFNSQDDFVDDIYFKFSGNATHMQLNVIRKFENKLYLREIYIRVEFQVKSGENKEANSAVDAINEAEKAKESKFIVSFWGESPLMPEFFIKNLVKRIENSIFNTLYVEFYLGELFGAGKSSVSALMDYKLNTKIKDLVDYDDGSALIHDKLIIKHPNSTVKIYSLSDLKADPTLKITENNSPVNITKVMISQPFIFVSTDSNKVYCYKILLTPKGSISPELTKEDIDFIDSKLDKEKRKKIIAALCDAKDARNLKVYLDWKIENLTPDNFEQIPLFDTINKRTLECTEILLQFILKIDEDFAKMRMITEEIEKNFKEIISSGCPSIPKLLDKFFSTKIENGTPKSEYLPIYQTYDFRGTSLRGYFFVNSTDDDKDYAVKNSFIKVPDTLGTSNSLELTKCLCSVEDMKIFGTDFMKTYIRSKWAELRSAILILTLLMWLNIVLVSCLVSKLEGDIYFYLFVGVNCLLALAELIQAINLGIEEYIGISNINYSSIFQLLTSFILVLVYSDSYVFGFFAICQAYTVQKLVGNNSFKDTSLFMLILGTPFYIYLIVLIFTSNPFYFFLVFGILELGFYIVSYMVADMLLGMRLSLQCISVILFVFYSITNVYLLAFNLIILLCETGYLVKLIKNAEVKKGHIFDYIICFTVKSLVLTAFITENVLFGQLSLLIITISTLARTTKVYMEPVGGKSLQRLELICFRFGNYLLFAYFITGIVEFGYCLIVFNIIEFIWIRSVSFKGLIDDITQLLFNWNTVDILRYVISVIWVVNFEAINANILATEDEKLNFKFLTWVFVLLNLIKALLAFRAFDETRFYVRLIFKCVVDIIPFLIIFVFFTFSFGLLNVVEKSVVDFTVLWKDPFDQSVGGFGHNEDESFMGYIMFSIGTLLIVIVMLNLLISILGETFGSFLVEAKQIDYKVMIETVYEVEVLLFWRKWTQSVKYFASCDEIEPSGEGEDTAWQMKLGSIDLKLKTTRDELSGEILKIGSKLDEVLKLLAPKDPINA